MPRSDMKSCKMRSLPSVSLNLHKLMITHVAKAKFPKFLLYGKIRVPKIHPFSQILSAFKSKADFILNSTLKSFKMMRVENVTRFKQ